MSIIQSNQIGARIQFSDCFPGIEVNNGKITDKIDGKEINKTVKSAFKNVFERRFEGKLPEDNQSVLISGRTCKKIFKGVVSGLAISSAIIVGLAMIALGTLAMVAVLCTPFALMFRQIPRVPFAAELTTSVVMTGLPALALNAWNLMIPDFDAINFEYKEICELKSNEAIADFLKNGLTYSQFKQKYNDLFEHKILEQRDILMLMMRDAIVLSPFKFMAKHQIKESMLSSEIKLILENK